MVILFVVSDGLVLDNPAVDALSCRPPPANSPPPTGESLAAA